MIKINQLYKNVLGHKISISTTSDIHDYRNGTLQKSEIFLLLEANPNTLINQNYFPVKILYRNNIGWFFFYKKDFYRWNKCFQEVES